MSLAVRALLISVAGGVLGTGLGAWAGYGLPKPGDKAMACLLNATGGLILSIVCFELLPEAFHGGIGGGLLGLGTGIAVMMAVDWALERLPRGGNAALHSGGLLMLGVLIHNLPESIAVGTGFANSMHLGVMMTLAIMLHNFPEGLAMAVNLRAGGVRWLHVFLCVLLTVVPTAAGTYAGASLAGVSAFWVALGLGAAGGALLMVAVCDLLPRAGALSKGRWQDLCLAGGFVLGCLMTLYLHGGHIH